MTPARMVLLAAAAVVSACSSGHARMSGPSAPAPAAPGLPTPTPPPTPTRVTPPAAPWHPVTTAHPVTGTAAPGTVPFPGRTVTWTVGAWQPAGRPVNGSPAIATALLQPDDGGAPVAAARLDTSQLKVVLYAGTADPPGTWTEKGAVPASLWPTLVATFNSGFELSSSRGGYYADGRTAGVLRNGAASLVVFQDGSATVGDWGRDVSLTGNVVAVRQDLELLVDAGRAAPDVATNILPTWGFTLGNVISTWRSAVGVDGVGQLIYVGGPGLDPSALAQALIAVGAVRAMELDINPAWVSFDTFTAGPGSAAAGTKLLPGMNFSANHYLASSIRDFIAVFAR